MISSTDMTWTSYILKTQYSIHTIEANGILRGENRQLGETLCHRIWWLVFGGQVIWEERGMPKMIKNLCT